MVKTLLSAHEIQLASSTGKVLLSPTSLELYANDRVALTGKSGSGKSLLLRCMVALNPGQAGELKFLGESVSANIPAFRARCLYVPQSTKLESHATKPTTVVEELRAPFQLQSHSGKSFSEQRICTWLDELHRDESFLSQSTATLSGGEQQVVAILRALQLDPLVLLLDEPTSALDEETAFAMEAIVKQWLQEAASERALVWISHDSKLATRIGTRHWFMQNGQLEERTLPKDAEG